MFLERQWQKSLKKENQVNKKFDIMETEIFGLFAKADIDNFTCTSDLGHTWNNFLSFSSV